MTVAPTVVTRTIGRPETEISGNGSSLEGPPGSGPPKKSSLPASPGGGR